MIEWDSVPRLRSKNCLSESPLGRRAVARFPFNLLANMRFFRRLVFALAVAGVVGAASQTTADAQVTNPSWPTISTLRSGDTVRVWASAPPLSGRTALVAGLGSDTLSLGDLPGRRSLGAAVAVPFRNLARIEVHRGYRRSAGWTVAGVLLGLGAGALVGSFAGVTLECGGSCSDQGDLAGLAGFVIGGGLGAIAGGIAGGIIGGQRRSRWQPVALPSS